MATMISKNELLVLCGEGLTAANDLLERSRNSVRELVGGDDIDSDKIDSQQFAVHGFAWMATYVEALRQNLG